MSGDALYQRSDLALSGGAGAAALPLARPFGRAEDSSGWRDRLAERLLRVDWTPDLGANIGSRDWWRGLVTCTGLVALAWQMSPGFGALTVPAPPAMSADAWDEASALAIAPLALGGDTGRRMAATDAVRPLTDTPERPSIALVATLGQGDGFARVLTRAGVGAAEASRVASMVSQVTPLADIRPGTRMDVTLGRRANRNVSRPLDHLAFRARFDLRLELTRVGGLLMVNRLPIAVDRTPLRIQGRRGDNLYSAARAAGVPPSAIESFLKVLAGKMSLGDLRGDDRFDLIVEHARAETGETETGALLYAGLDQGRRKLRLMPWTTGGRTEWYEASGVGEKRGGMASPVSGRLTSGFGMRRHPLLGYSRFHKGQDFGAPSGTPIHAVSDGTVVYAGRKGGYGNFVGLNHAGGMGSGYGHMSRIAVSSGARVRQGQLIGYVGSTGMSTGPHLHFEVYKNGQAVNPRTVSFAMTSQLSGADLRNFRARLAKLTAITPGGRVAPLAHGNAR